jgi:hypothetical protein
VLLSGEPALVLPAVVLIVGVPAFLVARHVSRHSGGVRVFLLIVGACSLLAGIGLGVYGPSQIPDTPGSPAALVIWLILVALAGGLGIFGLAAFLGAAFGRARR